jgi:cell division transport system permease protein
VVCISHLRTCAGTLTFVELKSAAVANPDSKPRKRKVSYLPSIISISLVLFMLGLFGIILINGNKLSEHIRENFQLTIFFQPNAHEADILRIRQDLEASESTRLATYVSSDEAAKKFTEEIGQDFVSFLGFNPLLPSIELFLKAGYTTPEKITEIDTQIRRNKEVQDIVYQKPIIEELNRNIRTIASVLIALSLVFLLIAVTLINNTIRLHLYARRFIIKSMQMVGATHWFIIRPFAVKSLLHGLYGGMIACILLGGLLYALPYWITNVSAFYDIEQFAILFAVVIIAGIIFSMISSMISTNHYLRMKIDDLY